MVAPTIAWRRRSAVATGGAAGTGARALVAWLTPAAAGAWPWATFGVNLTGAFVLGVVLTRLQAGRRRTSLTVPLVCTGLLGSYTTFSAFVVEVAELGRRGAPLLAVAYAVVSVGLGFAVAQLGVRVAGGRP